MKIPIRNLYFLFLYSWARFPGGAMRDTGVDESPDLPNLFAKLLLQGVQRLFRRGLDRGYRSFTEETAFPRGRLRLERMIKELTFKRGRAICDYDELSHDVLHNQILKATLVSLGRCTDVEAPNRHDLLAMSKRLSDVSDIRIAARDFGRVQLSRNSAEYGFLMRLCEFVFWSLMPDEQGAQARFQSVLEDEARMSAVFEDFLRNFLQMEQSRFKVRGETMQWAVSETSEADLAYLPEMRTDITLRDDTQTIIIDAKYYKNALTYWHGERVRSEHLYQLSTYLQHERLREPQRLVRGILIYPTVQKSLRLRYTLLGNPVTVATIDLSRDWRDVSAELLGLVFDTELSALPALAQS